MLYHHVEMFIVRVDDIDHPGAPTEYLDKDGNCGARNDAFVYWDLTEALAHSSIARAQGFDSDAERIMVTLQ